MSESIRRTAFGAAITLCFLLFACKSDSGTESDNNDQGGSITFSGQCVHPAVGHSFTIAKAGELTASFVGKAPSSGTICVVAEDGSPAVCANPGQKLTGTFTAEKYRLTVNFTSTVPSCSYTVQVDFPK